jgi:hypothetical protein
MNTMTTKRLSERVPIKEILQKLELMTLTEIRTTSEERVSTLYN